MSDYRIPNKQRETQPLINHPEVSQETVAIITAMRKKWVQSINHNTPPDKACCKCGRMVWEKEDLHGLWYCFICGNRIDRTESGWRDHWAIIKSHR